MSNTTCRPRGIAKRALALLTAIALATALTPGFAFAGEVNMLRQPRQNKAKQPKAQTALQPLTMPQAGQTPRRMLTGSKHRAPAMQQKTQRQVA